MGKTGTTGCSKRKLNAYLEENHGNILGKNRVEPTRVGEEISAQPQFSPAAGTTVHWLCIQSFPNKVKLLQKVFVMLKQLFYFLAGVHGGGVVAAAEKVTNRRK